MDEKAFEQMAGRLRDKVVAAMRRFGLDAADADDVAQDVMLRLWQMRGELGRFRSVDALALVMARRMALNALRRTSPESMDAKPVTVAGMSSDPSEMLEDRDNEEWFAARLSQLPDTWHTILYMRQVERRGSSEIAALLGIRETSVRTLLARARKTLFDEMKRRR